MMEDPASLRHCRKCGQVKPLSEFRKDRSLPSGYRRECKTCARARAKRYRGSNLAEVLVSAARARAKKRGQVCDLDVPEIRRRLATGRCELSGIPFRFGGGRTWDSPSIDRIDSAEGYTMSNVRIVLDALNTIAGSWGLEKAFELLDAVRLKQGRENELSPLAG